MKITEHICLIGLPGCGKSTLAKTLAEQLDLRVVDTDALIEKSAGKTITRIFDEDGEERFRDMESEVIAEVVAADTPPAIIALGGGAFERPQNREAITANGVVIYLQSKPQRLLPFLLAKSDRPLLRAEALDSRTQTEQLESKLAALFQARKENYEKADFIVPCDVLTEQSEQVESILKFLRDRYGTD